MKTQLIQLEPHDDRVSVRDRMDWAKTPRILLLWPKRRRTRIRALDLRLLQRHAKSLGAQLGLVTQSESIRQAAAELGIPVFESPADAQNISWRVRSARRFKPRRRFPRSDLRAARAAVYPPEPKWRRAPGVRVVFFTLGVLAVVSLSLAFLPRAEVTLQPESETQSVSIPVFAGPDVTGVFLSGSLPSHPITVEVEATRTVAISGTVLFPDQPAEGAVVFRNLTDGPVTVPEGTVVLGAGGDPVRFAVLETAEVPPYIGGLLQANVRALQPGAAGNLPAGSLRAIEGPLGLSLTVTNPGATTGGTDVARVAPDAAVRASAREALLADADAQAEERMLAGLPSGSLILPDTLRQVRTITETSDPPEGQAGSRLTISLRAEYAAQYVSGEDLRALAEATLNAGLPEGYVPRDGTLQIESATEPVTGEDGGTRWTLDVSRAIRPAFSSVDVMRRVLGRRPAAAAARLRQQLPLVSDPVIRMYPAWWPWLPAAPFRIVLRVD